MTRPRQDRRLVEIALVFLNLPDAVTAAKEHIAAEFARTDGQVGAATGDGFLERFSR